MNDGVSARLQDLSPAQRALLERRLLERQAAGAQRRNIPRRKVFSPVPLSHSQELLWLLSQFADRGIAYNAPAAFRLRGPIDAGILEQALQLLADRHEILRTRYELIDDRPMQIVESHIGVALTCIDLSAEQPDERERKLHDILQKESEHPFDLSTDRVMRSTLIKLGRDDHVFLHVLHHIATDGYSRAIIFRDLTTLYDSIADGRPSPLQPLPIQYADYAVWHRSWLDSGVGEQQLEYWKQRLAGAPSRLELPTDFPRPPVRSHYGDHRSMMIDVGLREGLRQVSREHAATFFIGLLSVFATLLYRYSSQEDIVIGTPFAGRSRAEFETMVGYFINPLALRIDLSGDPSFRELLTRARETTIEAFKFADVPYGMVVNSTNPERDLSQTPVYQAMMVLHNPAWRTERPTFEPRGVTTTEAVHQKEWSKFDVLLGMSERQNGLNATWEYSTELFAHETIERMTQHFRQLMSSAVANPDRPLSRLPMLTDDERSHVLGWSSAGPSPRGDRLVKELFERHASRNPDADAVVFEGERLTYGELNGRANRVAHRLRQLGVGPGSLVGIYMEKSLDLVVSVIAVIKAGGAYVPLDPLYPEDRIEFMLSDASPAVLLTHEHLRDSVPATPTTILALSAEDLREESAENPESLATPDDLAYIIYTSGSTGRPKGAVITNRSLSSVQEAYEIAYHLGNTTCHLQMASFSFDVFTGDLVRSLLGGRKLVLCPLTTVMDPPRLYELMVREGVDCAEFVPSVASLLFEHVKSIGSSLDFMRTIIISSEAWRNDKATFFKTLCGPQTRLINSYGLTEATIDSTYCELSDVSGPSDRFVPIGRPLANTTVYVLDANLEPVPIGLPGELCVGGLGVARGYLNRPDLTAQRFVADPFTRAPDGLLYRTGDLVRWLADGNLEYLGRTDRQIKIRGFRIEPGEIEAALERFPGIRAAAIVAFEDRPGDTWLAAYVEAVEGDSPSPQALRAYLSEELPAFMVPSSFTVLDRLPLSPNGKVDRAALPQAERSTVKVEAVPPRDDLERKLVEIWMTVLELEDPIGVNDDFFALGGHSLLAVRVFAEIEREIGVKLPLALLFQGATIERIATAVRTEAERAESWSTLMPLRPQGTRRPLFLMHGIDGEVLFYRPLIQHLHPDQPIYAVQPTGLDGKKRPHLHLEKMAAEYANAIRAFQPEGPYLLAGHCFSGIVAYEVARQLHEQGQRTAFLGVIDAIPVGYRSNPTRVQLEREKFRDFLQRDFRGKAAWIARRWNGLLLKIRKQAYWLIHDTLVSLRRPLATRVLDVHAAIIQARSTYVTRESPCRVTLFRATGHIDESFDRIALWRRLAAGGVDVRPVGGPEVVHDNILEEPHVQKLAAEFNICLANASADQGEAAAEVA